MRGLPWRAACEWNHPSAAPLLADPSAFATQRISCLSVNRPSSHNGSLARDTMTSSSPPQPRLLDDPNLGRLFGMVLGYRKVLAFALLATLVAAATDPILAKL